MGALPGPGRLLNTSHGRKRRGPFREGCEAELGESVGEHDQTYLRKSLDTT